MICEIISTGAGAGNAVLLNGCLLFDCGVPWHMLQDIAKQISFVFLTHKHFDHFNIRTIGRLARLRPLVKFVCSSNLLVELASRAKVPTDRIIMVRPADEGKLVRDWMHGQDLEIHSFHLIHDVENVGWIVRISGSENDGTAMYATDTHHIPIHAPNLDLYMIEGNYTTGDMERRIAEKMEAGVFSYESRVKESHMSMETAVEWLRENADPYKSKIVFLHGHVKREEEKGSEE